MKFSFRRSRQLRTRKYTHLRLRGRNTPKPFGSSLPTKNISLYEFGGFDDAAHVSQLKRFLNSIRAFIKRKEVRQPIFSLPFLLGSICAVLTVCAAVGSTVALSLFANSFRPYTSVSIPNFLSLNADTVTSSATDVFEYLIEYEENFSYPDGTVISQSPKSNVVRRLYRSRGKIKIKLTVAKQPEPYVLPDIVGTNLRDTLLTLQNQGIKVAVSHEYSSSIPYGDITYSSLSKGVRLTKGDSIALRASLGTPPIYVKVPRLTGLGESNASTLLLSRGLKLGRVKYISSELPQGTVLDQSITAGEQIREDTAVDITVSGGKYFSP